MAETYVRLWTEQESSEIALLLCEFIEGGPAAYLADDAKRQRYVEAAQKLRSVLIAVTEEFSSDIRN